MIWNGHADLDGGLLICLKPQMCFYDPTFDGFGVAEGNMQNKIAVGKKAKTGYKQ